MEMIDLEAFNAVDMRVGTVVEVKINKKSRNPAYKLKAQEFTEDMKSLGGAKASADALLSYLNK